MSAAPPCFCCTVRPGVERCSLPRTSDLGLLCRRCHATMRLGYACKDLTLEEAREIYERREDVS